MEDKIKEKLLKEIEEFSKEQEEWENKSIKDYADTRHYKSQVETAYLNCENRKSRLKQHEETKKAMTEDEIGFLNYLIEYPELCQEKCKERKDELKQSIQGE